MVTLFGYIINLPPPLDGLDPIFATFLITALAWIGICFLAYLVLTYVLKAITRRLAGEVEDILLGILRKPIIILLISFGLVNTLETLPLHPGFMTFLGKLLQTILILVVLYLFWRLIKDVIIYYGKGWARKTESKIDDNLIPILNIFGPLAIVVIGVLMVLPMWGLDISSALVGAGVIGLVLGLALQDSLSNLFSGMSLVVEAAYRIGDLLQLADGTVCEVEEMGLRSTRMYSLDSHCTLFMPNKSLANMTIINITKPTVEQRDHIEFSLPSETNMAEVEAKLIQIAGSVPGVLVHDLWRKIELVQQRLAEMEASKRGLAQDHPLHHSLEDEITCYRGVIVKLEREQEFNQALVTFMSNLEELAYGLRERETMGFSIEEKREIKQDFLAPAHAAYQALLTAAESWRKERDPYASTAEHEVVCQIWERRNERLKVRWDELREKMTKPDDPTEMRLDDLAIAMGKWLRTEYRILPESWKNPRVTFKSFDGDTTILQLWFYVDNIRLERDGRLQRVRTDIARRIREELKK
jgi:small-conductance mechanosensitive channel